MRSFLSISLCLGLAAFAQGAIQKGSVEVVEIKGPSDLINAANKRAPLSRGLTFQEGNRIETQEKSTAELVLSNGSTIKVSPNTLMAVKTFSQVTSPLIVPGKFRELSAEPSPSVVQIEVYRGKIDGEVRKLNPNTQYTIKTPVGLVRVRGTVLSVAYYEDKNGVGRMQVVCTTGSVSVRANTTGGNTTTIGPGEDKEVVGTPDNVVVTPAKPADINSDGIPDVPVDRDGDGKADGVDVNGDGKADNLVSDRSDGRLNGIDVDGDGKPDFNIDTDGDGVPEVAIDANSDGVPEAVVSVQEIEQQGGFVATPLTYPQVADANGKTIEVVPPPVPFGQPPPADTPPPPPPPPPPPVDDSTTKIIQKETQEQVSPSGG